MKNESLMLALYVGPIYLVFGLSVLLYAKQWTKVIAEYTKNHFVLMTQMMIALLLGLIIVNLHNVWVWDLSLIITLTGWGALLKGVFYFLAPESWIKTVLKCPLYKSTGFMYFWGLVLLVVGALLSYNAYDIGSLLV